MAHRRPSTMKQRPLIFLRRRGTAVALGLIAAVGHSALADDGQRAGRAPMLPEYQQECASCHIAFPPGMLPAASWQRLMDNLPRHYGSDASLEPATLKELSTWLAAHAATYKRVSEEPPQERITRSAWFVRKHDEVPTAAWKIPAVKSPSNCAACH